MVTGGVGYVCQFLETSPDSQLFLHGLSCDGVGATALHRAACEQYWEMLQLLQKGAEVNCQDFQGRSPLMEAALWGRVDNVKILLDHGADPTLVCVRNNRQLRAIDLARSSEENEEERSQRAGGVYREDVGARSRDRKTIENLLAEEMQPAPDTARLRGFAYTASPSASNIFTLFAIFDVPSDRKTVGVLWRGPKFPTVAAMSGWSDSANEERNITISNMDWTSNVLRLYGEMKLELEPHGYDQGVPGRFYACHAEKQLIAWFLDRHLLSVRANNKNETDEVETLEAMMGELSLRLRHEPPVSLKKAEIMVCRPICQSCVDFTGRVNSAFGLEIILRSCSLQ